MTVRNLSEYVYAFLSKKPFKMPPSGGILEANFFDLKICKTAKLTAVESLLS